MSMSQAKTLRVGDKVQVRAGHINSGITTAAKVTAIDKPGREFGISLGNRKFATVFNDEIVRVG